MTDTDLLTAYARTGSEEAVAEILQRYASMVYRTCLRVLGNPQDAEDAA